jgi:hypothetical protein
VNIRLPRVGRLRRTLLRHWLGSFHRLWWTLKPPVDFTATTKASWLDGSC